MAEPRRSSWPWRKKSSMNHVKQQQDHRTSFVSPASAPSPVSSFKEDDRVPRVVAAAAAHDMDQQNEEPFVVADDDGSRLLDEMHLRQQAEEGLKAAKEELSAARREVSAKDASLSQHQRAIAEAISEKEATAKAALLYKQELEATTQQKSILEDRVAQLDGALRECTKQVKQAREEQEKKIQEAILGKAREWERIKAEVDARQADMEQKLMESEAQKSAMAKSLQERARKMMEANEAKAMAETEVKLLQVKLSATEKEVASLKYELHVASKEVDIRNEEVEFMKKSADAAHRQHLENVKKMANLEADCQRLRNLVRKKLPGPAAIAQMRKELDISPPPPSDPQKRRPTTPKACNSNNRDIQLLRDRMLAMEAETKLLKEALSAKRNDEPSSPFPSPTTTTASLFSVVDDSASVDGGSGPERTSWASALITELALFTKDKSCPPSPSAARPPSMPNSPIQQQQQQQPSSFPSFTLMCQEVDRRLCAIQQHLQNVNPAELGHVLESFDGVHQRFLDIESSMRGGTIPAPPLKHQEDVSRMSSLPIPPSSLDILLSKIVSLLEILPKSEHGDCKHDADVPDENTIVDDAHPQSDVNAVSSAEQRSGSFLQKEALISSKERFLQGKSSIFEYVVRLAMALGELCVSETTDLEDMLSRLTAAAAASAGSDDDGSPVPLIEVNAAGYLSELSVLREQLLQAEERKSKLQQQLSACGQELEASKAEVDQSKQLLDEMKGQLAELEGMKKRLCDEEASRAEVQNQLEASEAEVSKLQASVAALKQEVADLHDNTKSAAELHNDDNKAEDGSEDNESGVCDFAEGDSSLMSRKEQELVDAKTKLVECQRTIVALGKQLTALASTPSTTVVDHSSSVSSFDGASSMDSAPQQTDRRMQMELQSPMTEELHHQHNHHPHQHHHNGNGGSKYGPRGIAMQNHHFLQQQQRWGHAQNGRLYHQEDMPQQQRGWNSNNRNSNGSSSGTSNGVIAVNVYGRGGDTTYNSSKYSNAAAMSRQQEQRRGLQGLNYNTTTNNNMDEEGQQLQYDERAMNNGECRNGYHQNLEDVLLLETEQELHGLHHRHQQQQIMNCYSGHLLTYHNSCSSPPLMSPARSPGRYIQQLGTRGSSRTGVCASLADSMNAVACSRDSIALPATPTSATKTTGLGRLFSRSKNRT